MGHSSCCVVNCKNTGRNSKCKFYRFPRATWKIEQRMKWIAAVKRKNADGSPWYPKPSDLICSDHFIGNKKADESASPSYVPTIFPTVYRSKISNGSATISRYRRFMERRNKTKLSNTIPTNQPVIHSSETYHQVDMSLNTGKNPQRDQEGVVQKTDILCKNCQNVIVGFRYKCITCEDYDLCKKCEMMETHSEHYVLRIPKPLKCKEAKEIAQKLQQMFKPDEDIPPIKVKEEDQNGVSIGECDDDEQIKDDNVDEDIHSTEQFKNITHSEVSHVIDKSKDVGEPTGTVRRKRKRMTEREMVGDGKRMFDADAKVNAAQEIAVADDNSDLQNSCIEEVKQEICEESSEIISRLEVGETVNPYVKDNQL